VRGARRKSRGVEQLLACDTWKPDAAKSLTPGACAALGRRFPLAASARDGGLPSKPQIGVRFHALPHLDYQLVCRAVGAGLELTFAISIAAADTDFRLGLVVLAVRGSPRGFDAECLEAMQGLLLGVGLSRHRLSPVLLLLDAPFPSLHGLIARPAALVGHDKPGKTPTDENANAWNARAKHMGEAAMRDSKGAR